MQSMPRHARSLAATALASGLLALCGAALAQQEMKSEGFDPPEDMERNMIRAVEQAPYGAYITDHEGFSLYMFAQDERGGQSTCDDVCASAWPAYVTALPPEAGPGVAEEKIGIIEREGGAQQATYAGWPLYYFRGDKQAGDALGQNVRNMGAHWYLVSPQGEPITQGPRSGESPMEVVPSRGTEPASEGQEVHDRTEDVEGADYDA
ncbi:MAG: hypothetical protein UMU75_06030 [Halomonas sp.]|nr:hypothetical protein [Halomonas sp.]